MKNTDLFGHKLDVDKIYLLHLKEEGNCNLILYHCSYCPCHIFTKEAAKLYIVTKSKTQLGFKSKTRPMWGFNYSTETTVSDPISQFPDNLSRSHNKVWLVTRLSYQSGVILYITWLAWWRHCDPLWLIVTIEVRGIVIRAQTPQSFRALRTPASPDTILVSVSSQETIDKPCLGYWREIQSDNGCWNT